MHMHAHILSQQRKNSSNERDRDRWKEGSVCLWGWKDVLAQTLVVRSQWLFCFSSQKRQAHSFFSLQKATDWRPNISFFPRLFCRLPFLSFCLSFSICLVRLVNPGLKHGTVTGAWCPNAADTARVADGKKKSDALCQLADTPQWCSVLSVLQKNWCLRGCKPAIMWATEGVLAAVRSLMQTRRHCTNFLSF